ncbi:FecR domain-containing protein [Sphingomonas sp. H39-1-10]|uniref:FecR family protein n=1 Tax=Sphingomonas pollutisoli TaxID=3030829 RepID=UPI0023B9C1BC|nr:FecR domain-containing protein [Sphingomonas pollutisoli]MDF0487641.1 FecR domain-containing protein [Sphingomonas pollutisoli]
MTRRSDLAAAARWTLAGDDIPPSPAPPAAADLRVTLDDPALGEAMTRAAGFGRLSNDDIREMRAARRRKLVVGGTATLALALGIGAWQQGAFGPSAPVTTHYETKRGQQLDLALADGSRLQLNGDTSVDVTLGDRQRRVALRRGEVYFDVAHEPARPFVVAAAGSETRVLGTAFDVDVARREVKLDVYRGRVRFGGPAGSVDVPAGWRSRFAGGVAQAPVRFDAAQQDWRQDWLDTDNMRLEDLVDALNRRGGPMIAPPPPALAGLTLSGRFKLDNAETLLGAIGAAYGFETVRTGDRIRIVETSHS